ncbi:MAG: propionyl-CoA carboxylase [Firmicutes bacterium]|nr:propionyl-CoA carboxylase [Bacillota bacterium]
MGDRDNEPSTVWQPELNEMAYREEQAKRLGGPENVDRHHRSGRLTARERIFLLLDPETFHEIGILTGKGEYDGEGQLKSFHPSNIIMGKGKIAGRTVVVAAEDFTVRGGSSEATSSEKWQFAEQHALEYRLPLIRLVDAAGGSIKLLEQSQSTKIPGYPHWRLAELLGVVPVVGVALGPCAGLGTVRVVASHFSVMVKGTSQVFAAGPAVVGPGISMDIDKEDLGGSKVHAHGSGVVDNEAVDEQDAMQQVRQFLSFLPPNVFHISPRIVTDDPPGRTEEQLASVIPRDRRTVYNMRTILNLIFDKTTLFEVGQYQGRSSITMLGRLNGYAVGIMANDPYAYGGAMTAEAAEKITRFVDMCDSFHLPIVNFIDQPGVYIGPGAEAKGTIRKAIRARMAIGQASVPWATVFVRRAFGVAGATYGPLDKADIRMAWPSAYWGSIPVEGGVEAAYRREISKNPAPENKKQELMRYYHQLESPFRTAEKFGIEEIIDPRNTRRLLTEWTDEAYAVIPETLGITRRTMRM